jgi:hypothetical protein
VHGSCRNHIACKRVSNALYRLVIKALGHETFI